MVFPYMDHDLAGLLENERVKLQPSHIKLYMKQLLEGTEYMHRVCFAFSPSAP
jgi:serine/threonine-protein kinase BUR1